MLKIIGLVLLAAVVIVLVIAATKPSTFTVARTVAIKAPPEKIAAAIANFHRWPEWSPYEHLDPAMKRTLSGAPEGKGAIYAWQGNSKAGEGRMEILESSPQLVKIQLDFTKPFASSNIAEFTLVPNGDTTNVTWAMHGPNLYMGKVMSVFMNMDKMIGDQFTSGLQNLKAVSEKS